MSLFAHNFQISIRGMKIARDRGIIACDFRVGRRSNVSSTFFDKVERKEGRENVFGSTKGY